jgi:hypothetical protein
MRRKARRGDRHYLDPDGMVACNPRDREAAHRAQTEGIATGEVEAVTCRKCRVAARRIRDAQRRPGGGTLRGS